jgi:hypothetical protein
VGKVTALGFFCRRHQRRFHCCGIAARMTDLPHQTEPDKNSDGHGTRDTLGAQADDQEARIWREAQAKDVYRPEDLPTIEDEQLRRHALRLRAHLAACRPHNREQVVAAIQRDFEAIGFHRWPGILQNILCERSGFVIEKGARPWPIWEFLALATGVDWPLEASPDRSNPLQMCAAMLPQWEGLLDLCCEILNEPARFENEANHLRPHAQAEGANAEDEWRIAAGLSSGPPPDPKRRSPRLEPGAESSKPNSSAEAQADLIPARKNNPADFSATGSCVPGARKTRASRRPGSQP